MEPSPELDHRPEMRNFFSPKISLMLFLVVLVLGGCRSLQTTTPAPSPSSGTATRPAATATPPAPSPTSTRPALTPTLLATDEPPPAAPTATFTPAGQPAETEPASPGEPPPGNVQTGIDSSAGVQDCLSAAAFVGDLTIPDGTLIRQGDTFSKSWRVSNTGTCTWGPGYSLIYDGGELMNGPQVQELPATAPGGIADITVELTAPLRGGSYTGYWAFQDPAGARFGVGFPPNDPIWAEIAVNFIQPTGVAVGLPSTGENTPASPENPEDPSTTPETPASGGSQPVAACPVQRDLAFENELFNLINSARTQNGLTPLVLQAGLTSAALAHSQDMACYDVISHVGSNGSSWYDRISAQGYAYSVARENIYVGSPSFGGTPQGAFEWWMNSQIHRDNILAADISSLGIAYVYNASGQYGGYYTLVFARP